MKAYREITPLNFDDVFVLIDSVDNGFDYPVHYHPEFELTLIMGSSGNRIVGDSSDAYEENDLVLLGPFLQHKWDDKCISRVNPKHCRVITLQFEMNLFNSSLFRKNPFIEIREMLERSQRGIKFQGLVFEEAKILLIEMTQLRGVSSTIKFLELMNILAQSQEKQYLASACFDTRSTTIKSERINIAYQYILDNFLQQNLQLSDLSTLLNMSDSAFSHFFKKSTNKSFTQFTIDLRIGYASKLLIETDLSISEIGYQCFNNLTNFNRLFKKYRSCTPYEFRQSYKDKNDFDWTKQKTLFQFLPPDYESREILKPMTYGTTLMHA